MRVKIFSCHHDKPIYPASAGMFMPIWTGGEADPQGRWMTDLDGLNIHSERLDEMRQLFFVWRNLLWSVDYVGFEHYRRILLLDPLLASECAERYPRVLIARKELAVNAMKWRGDVDADTFVEYLQLRRELEPTRREALKAWIAGYDVICARRYFQHPVDDQWRLCALPDGAWQAFVAAITRSSYMAARRNRIDYRQLGAHFCNMFICKTSLFEEYMTFWAEVMADLRRVVDAATRLLGYLSERLFSLWMLQKPIENPLLRVTELPFLHCEDVAGVSRRVAAAYAAGAR